MVVRQSMESFFLVLAVGALVAIGAKRIGVPYNVALVVVGLLLVLTAILPHTPLDPEIMLVGFLPALVFEGALSADLGGLRAASRPILALAVPGVAISLLATAAVAKLALSLPFSVALLLGSVLAITDTVSVLIAFRSVRVPHRLAAIMEGESLFNDGTALVLVAVSTSIVMSGKFDAVETTRHLALAIVGGLALGAAFAAAGTAILRSAPDHLTAILVTLVLVFVTALASERMHASPVIAVVVLGLGVGRAARQNLEPSCVVALTSFWETIGFALNVLIFLLIGMQLEARELIRAAPVILLATIALHAGRAVAVYGCFALLRAFGGETVPMRWQHVFVFGNIKGALSMAAILALPDDLPYRAKLVPIVFGVTFLTLVAQALPFGRFLRAMGVTLAGDRAEIDDAKTTLIMARRGQAQLDELLSAGLLDRQSHAERRAAFQRQIIFAERVLRDVRASAALVDGTVLHAQKAAVLDASRRGLVDPAVAAKHVAQVDSALLLIAHQEHAETAEKESG
ncbi:MAG: cation:proton antiporter [Polyangiales bacterium]